jgi:hypothetical protein
VLDGFAYHVVHAEGGRDAERLAAVRRWLLAEAKSFNSAPSPKRPRRKRAIPKSSSNSARLK